MTTAKTPEAKMTTEEAKAILGKGYLSDSWERVGTDVTEFFLILKALDAVTNFETDFVRDLILCSPFAFDEAGITFKCYEGETPHGKRFTHEKFEKLTTEHLFNEMTDNRNCLLWQGGVSPVRICRSKGLRELMNLLGISGTAIDVQSPKRDAYVAELISKVPEKQQVTLVTRNEGLGRGMEKVMAVRSKKYTPIPLSSLEDVYNSIIEEDMGAIKCTGWRIDHDYAEIDIEFPDATKEFKELCGLKDDLQAGVRLATSGTGFCSFTAKETWRVNSTLSEHTVVKQKHEGAWNAKAFEKNVKENIFDEYAALPERLCELFDIVVLNEEIIRSAKDVPLAEKILERCIKEAFKQLNMASAFKSKTDEEGASKRSYVAKLTDLLVSSFSAEVQTALAANTSFEISAYDIAMAIMTLPERTKGIPKSYERAFANICGKAAYVAYKSGSEYVHVEIPDISFVA